MAAVNLTCTVHCSDLIPLFCKDCDHLLCCDCVTRGDHAGHNLCKVSEVAEFHQQELNDVLENEESLQFLEKVVVDSQGEQDRLAQHTEDLLRNIIDREEEIIAKVRIWRENMVGKIIQFREERDKCLKERKNTVSSILDMRESGFHLESERNKLEITRVNCEVRHLLADTTNSSSHLIEFEIGPSNSDLNDMFGKLSGKETSSDEIPLDEAEKVKEAEEGEDGECEDLKNYKFRAESINDIIPLPNLQAFLLSSGTVYLCDFNKEDFDAKPILSEVEHIAHIPTSGDVLCVMTNNKKIKRIANGNMVTTFVYTTESGKSFLSVCSGGNQAYAYALQRKYIGYKYNSFQQIYKSIIHVVNLFNEFGVILKTFEMNRISSGYDWELMETIDENNCIVVQRGNAILIDLQQGKGIKAYTGCVGTDPESRFDPTGITTDNENNILLAVQNDNAIHLLDSSLTFQKLLMTAEDGLHCPSSVALDRDGYLWVGCQNGQIHVVNYQYLLNTDRQARLKLTQQVQTIRQNTKSVQKRIGWWWWG